MHVTTWVMTIPPPSLLEWILVFMSVTPDSGTLAEGDSHSSGGSETASSAI